MKPCRYRIELAEPTHFACTSAWVLSDGAVPAAFCARCKYADRPGEERDRLLKPRRTWRQRIMGWFKRTPSLAQASLEKRYLGDHVHNALATVGITPELVERITGGCNCPERQQKLNELDAWAREVVGGAVAGARERLERTLRG